MKLLLFLRNKIGLRMEATITGVDRYGFFARGLEIPAEGLVPSATLPGPETYEYDRTSQRLIGRKTGRTFQLGDHVVVEIAKVDPGRRSLDFKLIGQGPTKQARIPNESNQRSRSKDASHGGDKRPSQKSGKRRQPEGETSPKRASKKRKRKK